MGIGASSGAKKDKQNNDDTTFCIICYENDIKTQRLACGHVFCSDCVSSIYVYEVWPRCPLCRQNICDRQTNQKLSRGRFDWFKICRRTVSLPFRFIKKWKFISFGFSSRQICRLRRCPVHYFIIKFCPRCTNTYKVNFCLET